MAPRARKLRLAIAAYDGAGPFWRTLAELLAGGFSEEQLGVAALAATFDRLAVAARPADLAGVRLDLMRRNMEAVQFGDKAPAAATHNGVHLSGDGSPPSFEADIEDQILGGSIVLGVCCKSSEQQWLSARILLQHSPHPVQTREVTLLQDA